MPRFGHCRGTSLFFNLRYQMPNAFAVRQAWWLLRGVGDPQLLTQYPFNANKERGNPRSFVILALS